MGKFIFWFVVIVAVLFAARLLARAAASKAPAKQANRKPAASPRPDMRSAESMVRCEHCGIHMPRSEAYLRDGKTWCGPEHARLWQRQS